MKRVCMISTTHQLKDSRIYYKEALSLKKNGYNVTHLFIGDKDEIGITDEGINYIEIRPVQEKNIYRTFSGLLESCKYDFEKKTYATYDKIVDVCNNEKFDIYHLHDLNLNLIGKKLKKLSNNPKIVYDVHETYPDLILDLNKEDRSLKKYLFYLYIYLWEIIACKDYDYIINVEGSINKKFQRLYKEKTSIIYNYPIIEQWINDSGQYKEEKKYDFIYSGGIIEIRGVLEIIRAINYCKRKGFNYKVIIVGPINDSNLESRINNYINENNLSDNVFFTGRVPHKDVIKYYNQSRIGLVPFHLISSLIKAIPIKIFEYLTNGLPVIVSRLQHLEEVVSHEGYECGDIIDIYSDEDFGNKMIELINNKEKYNAYSRNAFMVVKKYYNWEMEEKKLITIYNNL